MNFNLGAELSVGASAGVSAGNFETTAEVKLLSLEVLDIRGDLHDADNFESDFIGKDEELEVSQSIDISASDGVNNYEIVKGENSFTASGEDLDRVKKRNRV